MSCRNENQKLVIFTIATFDLLAVNLPGPYNLYSAIIWKRESAVANCKYFTRFVMSKAAGFKSYFKTVNDDDVGFLTSN